MFWVVYTRGIPDTVEYSVLEALWNTVLQESTLCRGGLILATLPGVRGTGER